MTNNSVYKIAAEIIKGFDLDLMEILLDLQRQDQLNMRDMAIRLKPVLDALYPRLSNRIIQGIRQMTVSTPEAETFVKPDKDAVNRTNLAKAIAKVTKRPSKDDLLRVLQSNGFNKNATARHFKVHDGTVHNWIKHYDIKRPEEIPGNTTAGLAT